MMEFLGFFHDDFSYMDFRVDRIQLKKVPE